MLYYTALRCQISFKNCNTSVCSLGIVKGMDDILSVNCSSKNL